jgi:hypothetical protein
VRCRGFAPSLVHEIGSGPKKRCGEADRDAWKSYGVDANEPDSTARYLIPNEVVPLTGTEAFEGTSLTVADFWRWAFSDLRTNIVRGILTEFLVAQAVGDPSPLRQAWDNFDVTTASGIRVEVKSSAYLQSWQQKKLSQIVFTGLTGRAWSAETNELDPERTLRADVYVFAAHTCRDPDQYDPLDLSSWEFKLMTAHRLSALGVRSVSKALLDRHAPETYRLDALAEAIERLHRAEADNRSP